MENGIKGVFTASGASRPVRGRVFDIALSFAGTGSVDIERQMPSGDWIKIAESVTNDSDNPNQIAEFPVTVLLRLNCTNATGDVEYHLQSTFVRD